MQIQPDYSHQLEEIAKALNRSSIPQWVVALISALVGAFLGIAGQSLLKVFDNWRDIHKMRRVLYQELLTIFDRVDAMGDTDLPEPKSPLDKSLFYLQEDHLRPFMKFDGEAYLRGHQDVYMQLPERLDAEQLYAAYHQLLDDDAKHLHNNSEYAKVLLAYDVEGNQLPRKHIKKFLGRAKAKRLLKRLHAIYEYQERLAKTPLSRTTEPMDRK